MMVVIATVMVMVKIAIYRDDGFVGWIRTQPRARARRTSCSAPGSIASRAAKSAPKAGEGEVMDRNSTGESAGFTLR